MRDPLGIAPIGRVQSPVTETADERWEGVCSRIVLHPEYGGGLDGLDQFSHALVVTYLHRAHFETGLHLRRRPRGLLSMPLVGIFSQRGKDRPNPIGVTAVKVVDVGPAWLDVQGLDAVDGTPVLDVKPYCPAFDRVEEARVPGWVDRLVSGVF